MKNSSILLYSIILFSYISIVSSTTRIETLIKSNFLMIQNSIVKIDFGQYNSYSIYAEDATFLSPSCKTTQVNANNITYTNCIISCITDFNVNKFGNVALTTSGLIFDLLIDEMIFHNNNDVYRLEFKGIGEFIMNSERPFLKLGVFTFINKLFKQFNTLVRSQYLKIVNDLYTPTIINKKDELNAILSLLFMRKPYFDIKPIHERDGKKHVTYLNYLSNIYDTIINMREGTKVGRLSIRIEYSVNYNLNYNEGYIHFDNFYFHNNDFTYDNPIFENTKTKEDESIIEFFKTRVPLDLIESRKSYNNEI